MPKNTLTDHKTHKHISIDPNLKMTSFKAHETIAERFKLEAVRNKMSIQKILNRAMDLYINDESFRKLLNNYNSLVTSGSL